MSELPSIGTQPISAVMTPPVLIQKAPPAFQTDTFENSYAITNSSNNHQEMTYVPVASITLSQRRLSRRAVLFGLAGAAIGSVVSNGLWLAKSLGVGGQAIHPLLTLQLLNLFYLFQEPLSTLTHAILGPFILLYGRPMDIVSPLPVLTKTVQIWDAATGGNVLTYQGHKDWVLAIAWSPDGKYIASGGGYYSSGSDITVQVQYYVTGYLSYTLS